MPFKINVFWAVRITQVVLSLVIIVGGYFLHSSTMEPQITRGLVLTDVVNGRYASSLDAMDLQYIKFIEKVGADGAPAARVCGSRRWQDKNHCIYGMTQANSGAVIPDDFYSINAQVVDGSWLVFVPEDVVEGGELSPDDVLKIFTSLLSSYEVYIKEEYKKEQSRAEKRSMWNKD